MSQHDAQVLHVHAVTTGPEQVEVDLLCVPVFQTDDAVPDLPGLDGATQGEIARARTAGEFTGKPYETFVTRAAGAGWRARRIALVGAGTDADFDAERARRVAAVCGQVARDTRAASAALVVRPARMPADMAARMFADGVTSAQFRVDAYKRPANGVPAPVTVWSIVAPGLTPASLTASVRHGEIIGHAANFSKALANEPGNVLFPAEFAARVHDAASSAGLQVDVLDEQRLGELGMGLLLGVGQGSVRPPRLVVMRHDPPGAPDGPVLALIGKGITFDTGGISIKPADGMDRMKDDMAGGAGVAAAMIALTRLGCPNRVIGLIPMAENMPSGTAIRPGDVLTGAGGKTVEVNNTDAEGRLVLGDAIWYAQQLGATHLVDCATLTGAVVVALGYHVSGLFGNDAAWTDTVRLAATRGGDRVWPMPIYEETREQLQSDIADMINSAGRPGGSCTAAAFLREFVDGRPWAHLDIAGTAWAETKKPYQPKGPTGVVVRTLVELAMSYRG